MQVATGGAQQHRWGRLQVCRSVWDTGSAPSPETAPTWRGLCGTKSPKTAECNRERSGCKKTWWPRLQWPSPASQRRRTAGQTPTLTWDWKPTNKEQNTNHIHYVLETTVIVFEHSWVFLGERHWIFFLWHSFMQKAPPVMILIDFKHTLTAVSLLKKSATSVIVLFVYNHLAHANKKSLLSEAEWIKSFAHSRVAHWH